MISCERPLYVTVSLEIFFPNIRTKCIEKRITHVRKQHTLDNIYTILFTDGTSKELDVWFTCSPYSVHTGAAS